jgi:hypothetical protein
LQWERKASRKELFRRADDVVAEGAEACRGRYVHCYGGGFAADQRTVAHAVHVALVGTRASWSDDGPELADGGAVGGRRCESAGADDLIASRVAGGGYSSRAVVVVVVSAALQWSDESPDQKTRRIDP